MRRQDQAEVSAARRRNAIPADVQYSAIDEVMTLNLAARGQGAGFRAAWEYLHCGRVAASVSRLCGLAGAARLGPKDMNRDTKRGYCETMQVLEMERKRRILC